MRGVPGSGVTKNPVIKVSVSLSCSHPVLFNKKIKPHSGEIIWCTRCEDYKKVVG